MYFILQLLIILHILIWIFVIFGGIISYDYAKMNIMVIIPLIYILHILPFHIIVENKLKIINNNNNNYNKNTPSEDRLNPMDILKKEENKYIIPDLFYKLLNLFSNSFANPLSPQGLLILGYIVNTYLIYYKWNVHLI
jgi:hypothetical protein